MNNSIRVNFDMNCPTLALVTGEHASPIFFEAMWGLLSYKSTDGAQSGCSFFTGFNTLPQLSEGVSSVELHFYEKKRLQTFDVKITGEEIPTESILRLGFFASADIGPIIVSYAPSWQQDARPLVMSLGGKHKLAPLLRHLGVVWLYEVFGDRSE